MGESCKLAHVADALGKGDGGGPASEQGQKPLRRLPARVVGIEGEEDAGAAPEGRGDALNALGAQGGAGGEAPAGKGEPVEDPFGHHRKRWSGAETPKTEHRLGAGKGLEPGLHVAPAQPVKSLPSRQAGGPGPLRLMVRKARHSLRMTSLGWTPGAVNGVIESECAAVVEEPVELQTVTGRESVTETALMDAQVTAISGMVAAATGASQANVPFVPNGETRFRLDVPTGEAIHAVTVDVSLEAALRIPIPPLTILTHHPERTEYRTETVSLWRPGTRQTVSETVTVTNDDGSTTEHTISATLSIPGETVYRDVTLTIIHPEHVKAETVDRSPVSRSRAESLSLASGVGSDDPFAVLVLPEPEPVDPPAEQEPADNMRNWFDLLGWEWPW